MKYIIIFLIALTIRITAWQLLKPDFVYSRTDNVEYFYNSINLTAHPYFQAYWHYKEWYQRTPIYTLFLHIIQRQLIFQILLSSFGVVLMYKMNKIAGLIWLIYPQEIIYSFQYAKESLLLFFVIVAIYLLRERNTIK
jgi:hypothetical protein